MAKNGHALLDRSRFAINGLKQDYDSKGRMIMWNWSNTGDARSSNKSEKPTRNGSTAGPDPLPETLAQGEDAGSLKKPGPQGTVAT